MPKICFKMCYYVFLAIPCVLIMKFVCDRCTMVIWKEREHEVPDTQAANDPPTIEALRNCGLLKYFRVLGMKAHIWLLEYIINMWDPNQEHFVIGVHIFPIEIEDIYFLTGLSMRES